MKGRHCAAVLLLLFVTAVTASAFEFDIHVEMTKEALAELIDRWWEPLEQPFRDEVKGGFSSSAVLEITTANKAKDTDLCGASKTNPDVAAETCKHTWTLSPLIPTETGAAIDYVDREPQDDHFDGESFQLSSNKIYSARQDVIRYVAQSRYIAARKTLGGMLHTLQDFYAHSNWVELNYGSKIADRIGVVQNAFSGGPPHVAAPNEPTCQFYSVGDENNGSKLLDHFKNDQEGSPKVGDRLTSGVWVPLFWTGDVWAYSDPDKIIRDHKCRHGVYKGFYSVPASFRPGLGQPGIMKDNSNRDDLFTKARVLAEAHTVNYLINLLNDPAIRTNPKGILGLMGHPTISSISPTKGNAGQNQIAINITGTGFQKPGTNARPSKAYLDNYAELMTDFISETQLRAYLSADDIAQPKTVQITVLQKDWDAVGNELYFSSNAVKFTIDPPAPPPPSPPDKPGPPPDCPGAIRPHRHDPRYTDVNANQWNDTGLLVTQGQKLNIEVLRGSVVWRAGGLFTGSAGEATPQGDPTATPGNTLLWVDPPVPINQVPIGGLIGLVVPNRIA